MEFKEYEEIAAFLEKQTSKTRRIIIKKLNYFKQFTKQELEKANILEHLGQNIYEIKIDPFRLLGPLMGATQHLVVMFRKKSDKAPRRHIDTAIRRGKLIRRETNNCQK